jgi:hypothetical protein
MATKAELEVRPACSESAGDLSSGVDHMGPNPASLIPKR